MVVRQRWSPSRIKSALQCGRRLQGQEEGWEKTEHIRGIRGRAVHRAVESWEASDRQLDEVTVVSKAWCEILTEAIDDPRPVIEMLAALWRVEAEIMVNEDLVVAELSDSYKQPRRTKAFAEKTAHLDGVRDEAAGQRSIATELIDGITWPWASEKGLLAEGFDHSLLTVRKGVEYLTGLWPAPDIVGAEWELVTDLDNGYRVRGFIDRVEASGGIVEVVDYKSSEFQETVLDHFLQAATYSVLVEDHMGFAPDRMRLVYLRDQKSAVFEVQPFWRERLSVLVEAADRVLESKAFAPTFSGCGICSYFHICEAEFGLIPIEIKEVAA